MVKLKVQCASIHCVLQKVYIQNLRVLEIISSVTSISFQQNETDTESDEESSVEPKSSIDQKEASSEDENVSVGDDTMY